MTLDYDFLDDMYGSTEWLETLQPGFEEKEFIEQNPYAVRKWIIMEAVREEGLSNLLFLKYNFVPDLPNLYLSSWVRRTFLTQNPAIL